MDTPLATYLPQDRRQALAQGNTTASGYIQSHE
jgi:hypothetical protein